jgi:hypothetical protein
MTHPLHSLLALLLAAIVIAAAFLAMENSLHNVTVPAPAPGLLGELPWTRHARDAHKDQAWSTAGVIDAISRENCSPIYMYSCPVQWEIRYVCPAERGSDLWLGLIVGYKTLTGDPIIITGYAARLSFWLKSMADDGCTLVGQIP